jgi:hypothetical protein
VVAPLLGRRQQCGDIRCTVVGSWFQHKWTGDFPFRIFVCRGPCQQQKTDVASP